MNAQLENLVVLQAQDLDLARLRRELAEAPRRVKEAEAAVAAAAKTVETIGAALAEEEKLRRGQESEIASQRSKVARLRRSLDAATSTAQVTAFEHEISFAQTTIARLEDEELASLERTEALDAQLLAAQKEKQATEQRLGAERTQVAGTVAENTAAIAGIEKQRNELRATIDPALLNTYDRLSKTKGTAVAEAIGNATQGKCSACQMSVRPQRWQDLTGRDHLDQVFTCETCGRMLFWDPRRDTPKPWAAGDRLQGAQAGSRR
jgi:uncharacterized protein